MELALIHWQWILWFLWARGLGFHAMNIWDRIGLESCKLGGQVKAYLVFVVRGADLSTAPLSGCALKLNGSIRVKSILPLCFVGINCCVIQFNNQKTHPLGRDHGSFSPRCLTSNTDKMNCVF